MRLAILSDVHANYYALKRAIDHAYDNNVTDYLFLGDLVGYGSMPLDSFELMENLDIKPHHWLVGNHDLMANGEATVTELQVNLGVSKNAKLTLNWFRQQEAISSEQNRATYKRFQDKTRACPTFGTSPHVAGLWLMHGVSVEDDTNPKPKSANGRTKSDNVFPLNTYIGNDPPDIISERLERSYQFACQQIEKPPRLMVGGHSHIASLWKRKDKGLWEKQPIREIAETNREHWAECPTCSGQGDCSLWQAIKPISLDWETVYINPGSVGQPRDGCPAVSMVIWDVTQNNIQFWRLNYDYRHHRDDLDRMIDYDKPDHHQMEQVVEDLKDFLKSIYQQRLR